MAEHSVPTSGFAPEPGLTLMHVDSEIDLHHRPGFARSRLDWDGSWSAGARRLLRVAAAREPVL